jgi:hypothetical protein
MSRSVFTKVCCTYMYFLCTVVVPSTLQVTAPCLFLNFAILLAILFQKAKSAPPHLWTTKPYSTTRVPLQRTSATTIQTTTCLRNRYNHFWLDQASSNTRSNASVYLGSFLWKKIFSSKYKSKYKLHQQWPAEKESTKIPVRLRTN